MSLLCLVLLGAGTSMLLSTAAPIDAIVPETDSTPRARFVRTFGRTPITGFTAIMADPAPTPTPTPTPPATPEVKIDFQHYINDTPPPASDVPVAPGTFQLSFGLDRDDGLFGAQNVFQWTYQRYLASRARFGGESVGKKYESVAGHEAEIYIDGTSYMVPDQLTMQGPTLACESASQSDTKIITSSQQMEQSEKQSRETSVGVDTAVSGVPVEAGMNYGSSTEGKEYEGAKAGGRDVSIFNSVTAVAYQTQLTGEGGATADPLKEEDLSDSFKGAVNMLGSTPTDDQLRDFAITFGTDFITNAELGGRISQQTTMKASDFSDSKASSVTEASQRGFEASVGPAAASTSSGKESSASQGSSAGTSGETEMKTAKFEGGVPSDSYYEWCASVELRPTPIKYRTVPISNLIRNILKNPVADKLEEFITVTRPKEASQCAVNEVYNKVTGTCDEAKCPAGTYGVIMTTCSCTTPNKGTGGHNAYTCTDGTKAFCAADEACTATSPFNKAEVRTGCGGAPKAASVFLEAATATSVPKETCVKCPAGQYGSGAASPCLDCAAGQFSAEGSPKCTTCPAGLTSDPGSKDCLYLHSGKYQIAMSTDSGKQGSFKYLAESASKKGDNSDIDTATENWAYWDKTSDKNMYITHASGNLYRISNTAESKKLVVESGGDKDKGSAKYWGKFTPSSSNDFTITCTDVKAATKVCELYYGAFSAQVSDSGDKDVPDGGKWLAFGDKAWGSKWKLTITAK